MDVIRRFERISSEQVERARRYSTATLFEANGRDGMVDLRVRGVSHSARLCGRALTIACHVGDNLMIRRAQTVASPEDVLVVAIGNDEESGARGELLPAAAVARGAPGS